METKRASCHNWSKANFIIGQIQHWLRGVKARTLGRQNERNFCYESLALTSIFGLCFMSVCLIKSNCYSFIYSSLHATVQLFWLSSVIFLKKLILLAWSEQIDIEQWGFEDCITNAFLAPFNLLHLRVYVLLERWAQDCIDISWQLRASVLAQY